jgi:hypothetical protein
VGAEVTGYEDLSTFVEVYVSAFEFKLVAKARKVIGDLED